jgi:Ras-related GTP-binding protein A/B
MENYFTSQKDHIFRNVQVLIYVFDVESLQLEKDLLYYKNTLDSLAQNSQDAKVFCLIHKMDLIPPEERQSVSILSLSYKGFRRQS